MNIIDLSRFLWAAIRAYRHAVKYKKPAYTALLRNGVPDVCVFVATGREAWRVSQYAIENWSDI